MDTEIIISIMESVPHWLVVFIISMSPFMELRGAIPIALGPYHMDILTAFALAYVGNLLPIPFILLFFDKVEIFLRRWDIFNRLFDWLFSRTRRKATERVEKYEELALILFVAIPLPGTGAWTGALIAYLFGLDIKKSFAIIAVGVFIAGVIVSFLTLEVINIA